jgi:hypothetical protein
MPPGPLPVGLVNHGFAPKGDPPESPLASAGALAPGAVLAIVVPAAAAAEAMEANTAVKLGAVAVVASEGAVEAGVGLAAGVVTGFDGG